MTLAGFAKRQQRGQKGTGRKRFGLSYICLVFVLRVSASAREMAEISLIRTDWAPGLDFDRAKTSL